MILKRWLVAAVAGGIAIGLSSPICSTAADPSTVTTTGDSDDVDLSAVLRKIESGGGNLEELLDSLDGVPVNTAAEAQQICSLLKILPRPHGDKLPTRPVLNALCVLFQQVETTEAYDVLQAEGTPELSRIFTDLEGSHDPHTRHSLMLLLKILAMYKTEQGTQCVVKTALKPFQADDEFWTLVLEQFDDTHPQAQTVLRQLSMPLPHGMIGVALLDMANELESAGDEFPHPFDTEEGMARLKKWLESRKEATFSYAVSAAASLPYLKRTEREMLLKLALEHPSPEVQIEGAFASAELGTGDGVERLSHWCTDVRYARKAMRYLEELDRQDAVPAETRDPKFQATADMCDWLAEPNEFGQPPNRIELVDTRELYWPPTDDTRRLWLFKYQYDSKPSGEEPVIGLGMVGSVTFAIEGENSPDRKPSEMYALHCCWELQVNEDPRAPDERTVEAGLRILKEKNPELAD